MATRISTFQQRFGELCEFLPYNDSEIAEKISVSRQSVSAWRTGVRSPKAPLVAHIAKTFGINVEWLWGFDVDKVDHAQDNVLNIKFRQVPMYESVACGEPIFATEAFSTPVAIGNDIECDFALHCKGNSMIGARIYDGDIVFVKQCDTVDDGQIAVCLIDDDATLKRVYRLSDGRVELRAENPKFPPIIIGGEDETRNFRILGKAVAFQSIIV